MQYSFKVTNKMKIKFQSEANNYLNQFEKMLLLLEKDSDNKEAVDSAFRSIHSLKGNSDYIGFKDINTLANELEDLLDEMRLQKIPVIKPLIEILFYGLDLLRKMNRQITEKVYKETDLTDIHNKISKIKTLTTNDNKAKYPSKDQKLDIKAVFINSSNQHIKQLRNISQQILNEKQTQNIKSSVKRILKTFCTSATYINMNEIVDILNNLESQLDKHESLNKDFANLLLKKLIYIEKILKSMISEHIEKADNSDVDVLTDLLCSEMKIDLSKIDSFMNQILELGIVKNRLNYLTDFIPDDIKGHSWCNSIKETTLHINKMVENLQTEILNLRLIKMNTLFERLPRIVKNLIEKTDKQINLSMQGGKIEIDRKIIEILIDPLIHMIRNAVDHGIEEKSVRLNMNKNEIGEISVNAFQEGRHVIIEVFDDGKGIDIKEIKSIAVDKNIISQNKIDSMSDSEILNLIFVAGFSTKKKTTSLSGRGVGMDIVNQSMKQIGGNVQVFSEKDKYTKIKLTVPISMAIKEVLLTEVDGDIYAFPFSAIYETIYVKPEDIQRINNRDAIIYKDNVLQIKHLKEIIGTSNKQNLNKNKLSVIILIFGKTMIGIGVDNILNSEGVLSKPLSKHLSSISEYSSAAVLGDGSIVLIINPYGIFKTFTEENLIISDFGE